MLAPMYRKAGVELTRITPSHHQLAILESIFKESPSVILNVLKDDGAEPSHALQSFRHDMEVDLWDVYRSGRDAPFGDLESLWNHRSKRTFFNAAVKGGHCAPLLDSALRVVSNKASQEQYRIRTKARKRFRGLYHSGAHCMAKFNPLPHHLFWQLGTDPCCMEFSSAPTQRWDQLKRFFTLSDTFLEREGCLRHSDYICGPGGHIHVQLTPKQIFKVRRQLLNQPWVMMAFADPSDDQHPLENASHASFHRKAHRAPFYPLYRPWRQRHTERGWSNDKAGVPIAYRDFGEHSTAEFRLFDSAQTWTMQEEHMAFAQAFCEWAIYRRKPDVLMSAEDVSMLTESEAIGGFKDLIRTLGLPWSRYRDYAYINIRTRFAFKTRNLDEHVSSWSECRSRSDQVQVGLVNTSFSGITAQDARAIGLTQTGRDLAVAFWPTTVIYPDSAGLELTSIINAERNAHAVPSSQSTEVVPSGSDEGEPLRCPHAEPSSDQDSGIAPSDVRHSEDTDPRREDHGAAPHT